MRYKAWVIATTAASALLLLLAGLFVAVVDPFFHYHAPAEGLAYIIDSERYQNDGIVKHFSYDAIITGTSMTENFRTTDMDALFGTRSVKTAFSGGSFREVNDNLERAFAANDDIRIVVRSLDLMKIVMDENEVSDFDYPTYLYDDALINDVRYLLNKDVILRAENDIRYTRSGGETTPFDYYANWMSSYTFGKEYAISAEPRAERVESVTPFTEEDEAILEANLTRNVTALAAAHPETEFYLFLPPYSVIWWDEQERLGLLERQLDINERTMELLLEHDNIHLFSFCNCFSVVTALDNYKDSKHYSDIINHLMLVWMSSGQYEVTRDNWQDLCREAREFYESYDYDSIYG